jgi:hypothetical protein
MMLFNPKTPVEAAQFNDLQRIIQTNVEASTSKIFNEGQFYNGGNITIGFLNPGLQVNITAGVVYALGMWHNVGAYSSPAAPDANAFTGTGTETLSLQVTPRVIKSTDDPALNDPAQGSEAYGVPSADAGAYNIQYVRNNPNAIPIATFINGQLVERPSNNAFLDEILAILALRTKEQSGSFTTTVPTITLTDPPGTNVQNISCTIDNGVGYVNGVRYDNLKTVLSIARPLSGQATTDFPLTFNASLPQLVYDVGTLPIQSVQRVNADIESGTIPMSRGSLSDTDTFPAPYVTSGQGHVHSVVSVTQVGTTFSSSTDVAEEGVDYELVDDAGIEWLGGGIAPATGTSYQAQVIYAVDLTPGVRTQTTVTGESHTVGLVSSTGTVTLSGSFASGHTISFVTHNSGLGGSHTTSYTTVGGGTPDTNASNLAGHLATAINADPTVNGFLTASHTGSNNFITLVSTSPNATTYTATSSGSEVFTPSTPVSTFGFTLSHADVMTPITSIKNGGTTYVEGTDFTVAYNTGKITWLAGGTPTVTSNYFYWAHTTEGDYVSRDSFVSALGNQLFDSTPTLTPTGLAVDYTSQISFDVVGGNQPVNSSQVNVDFSFSLPRIDVLAWGQDGILAILPGTPDANPTAAPISNFYLPICKFILPAEARSTQVVRENFQNQTLLTTDLRTMYQNIQNLLYDDAQFQLAANAQNQPTPTDKLGIFADNLSTPDLVDEGDPDFAGTFDFLSRTFSLPRTQTTQSPSFSSSDATNMAGTWVPTFTEAVSVQQSFASNARVINLYGAVNTRCQVTLSHTFVAQMVQDVNLTTVNKNTKLKVNNVKNAKLLANVTPTTPVAAQLGSSSSVPVTNPWFITKVATPTGWTDAVSDSTGNNPLNNATVLSTNTTTQNNAWATVTTNTQTLLTGNTPSGGTITCSGSVFTANEQSIQCTFNGEVVALTPTGSTAASTDSNFPGCVNADNNGNWTASFVIPPTVIPGSNQVEFYGHVGGSLPTSNRVVSYASVIYNASPNMEQVDITVTIPPKAPTVSGLSGTGIPIYALAQTLGLPSISKNSTQVENVYYGPYDEVVVEGYKPSFATWVIINKWAATSCAHVIASAIAESVFDGVTLTVDDLIAGLSVYAAYTELQTVVNGTVLSNIANAVNLSSTDIAANAALIIAQSGYFGFPQKDFMASITGTTDPLAQTFTPVNDGYLSSVDLFFAVLPANPVAVAISQVTSGVPTGPYLGTSWLQASSITSTTEATNFPMPKPIYLQGGTEYAFVVLTNDNAASIWTAQLGSKDVNSNLLITTNPATGVALESPDAVSWSVLAGVDLQFNINYAQFTNPTATVTLGTQDFGSPVCTFMFSAPFKELGDGTQVIFQYSTDAGNTWNTCTPTVELDLGFAQQTIQYRVVLTNSADGTLCPVLIDNPELIGFIYQASGAYLHRTFSLPSSSGRYTDVYVETSIPGGCSISPYVKLDGGSYVGPTTNNNPTGGMSLITADTLFINDTFTQLHYQYDSGSGDLHQTVKVKLVLASDQTFLTPMIRNVRVIES